jgi:serine/threonine-protein kinase
MLITRAEDGIVTARGFVPSPEFEAALTAQLSDMDGTADLTLATGTIPKNWGNGLLSMLQTASPLDEFRISVSGETAVITGLAGDELEHEVVSAAFAAGFPEGYSGSADISLGPRFLMPDAIEPVLQAGADCGLLRLVDAPPLGYGLNAEITITGRLSSLESQTALLTRLENVIGDRNTRFETDILNTALCQIDAALPRARRGGFDVKLGWGDQDGINTSGTYYVGDNPVIDVRLPEGVTNGYLWISVVDVQGVVYHLMPNLGRPDNSVAALRTEADAAGYVRVAYSIAEGTERKRLAFMVDDSVVGQSKVMVLHSDQKLFADLRPVTESAASYADALKDARNQGDLIVRSLDSAILTTVASE